MTLKMEMNFALQRNKDRMYLSVDKTFTSRSAIHKGAYIGKDKAEMTALMAELGLSEDGHMIISFPRSPTPIRPVAAQVAPASAPAGPTSSTPAGRRAGASVIPKRRSPA